MSKSLWPCSCQAPQGELAIVSYCQLFPQGAGSLLLPLSLGTDGEIGSSTPHRYQSLWMLKSLISNGQVQSVSLSSGSASVDVEG